MFLFITKTFNKHLNQYHTRVFSLFDRNKNKIQNSGDHVRNILI